MARNLFSVPIFFIVFRETLEASIIVAVLLGLVEQLVHATDSGSAVPSTLVSPPDEENAEKPETPEQDKACETPSREASVPVLEATSPAESDVDHTSTNRVIIRKMRIQIFAGAGLGLLMALAVGAAFIAVWFTQASDLWKKSEELWEGIFSLIASFMILAMGLGVLRMDRAKAKWRVKIRRAFNGSANDRGARAGRWALFMLPLITVLREGLEAVIFVGGVSLGQPAASIPIAAIVGIVAGLFIGYIIYAFASRSALRVFMIVMTNFILLIGAGLFSKAIWNFQEHAFNILLGADVDDAGGNGPGSYDVRGNVWHLACCNPEAADASQGWMIFGAVFGWTNSATLGSVLAYVFYWVLVIVLLVSMKVREGRTSIREALHRRSEKSSLPT